MPPETETKPNDSVEKQQILKIVQYWTDFYEKIIPGLDIPKVPFVRAQISKQTDLDRELIYVAPELYDKSSEAAVFLITDQLCSDEGEKKEIIYPASDALKVILSRIIHMATATSPWMFVEMNQRCSYKTLEGDRLSEQKKWNSINILKHFQQNDFLPMDLVQYLVFSLFYRTKRNSFPDIFGRTRLLGTKFRQTGDILAAGFGASGKLWFGNTLPKDSTTFHTLIGARYIYIPQP